MPVVCTYKCNSWYCKNFNEEYAIETCRFYSSPITSKSHTQKIRIHDKNEEYFPEGLASYFPRLNSLTITLCGLKSITRNQLNGLENLETLDLSSNFLKSLPDDLFTDMAKLKSILFQYNKLESISSKLLEPILKNAPSKIDFRGNSKIDAFYSKERDDQYNSLSKEQLMELIDTQCNKPGDEQVHVSTIESFKEDFSSSFAALWTSGDHSDFTIVANGSKEFRVHKTVLAIQSSFFDAMFKGNMEEQQTGKMAISDFSAEAVEQFLACLYTGEIKDVTNAMELFALAAKYDVPKLKMASEQNVLGNIDQSNAYEVFALGHLYSSTEMQHKAFNIIKQTLPCADLDYDLMADPKKLKAMITAIENRNRKMQKVEDEFTTACKRIKK